MSRGLNKVSTVGISKGVYDVSTALCLGCINSLRVYDTSSKESWSKDVLVDMAYGRHGQMADTTLRLIIT